MPLSVTVIEPTGEIVYVNPFAAELLGFSATESVGRNIAEFLLLNHTFPYSVLFAMDVANEEQIKVAIRTALDHFGKIDILVNNAGITRDRTLRKMSGEQWREVIDTNLNSLFYCTQPAIESMIEQGGGRIVLGAHRPHWPAGAAGHHRDHPAARCRLDRFLLRLFLRLHHLFLQFLGLAHQVP